VQATYAFCALDNGGRQTYTPHPGRRRNIVAGDGAGWQDNKIIKPALKKRLMPAELTSVI
jgi:hypothetical protein